MDFKTNSPVEIPESLSVLIKECKDKLENYEHETGYNRFCFTADTDEWGAEIEYSATGYYEKGDRWTPPCFWTENEEVKVINLQHEDPNDEIMYDAATIEMFRKHMESMLIR